MKYSEDFIEKVREANDLVELIGQHTPLKSGGQSLMGLCPFPSHQEKSPSFSVSQAKQLYHCFGCGKSGNIYSFLRDYYGYSFPESIEYLAKKAGIPLPEKGYRKDDGFKRRLNEQKNILSLAQEFYSKNLLSLSDSHPVKSYLRKRGMDKVETLKGLSIGWAPDNWSELVDFLSRKGVSLNLAADLGLVKKKKQGNGYFDTFRNRVLFPVFSFSGETLGFGGRVLDDQKPKYLNSPESILFKKNKILYGQNWSSPHIRQHDEVILVEGYTDWISLYLGGVQNALATMGTALTIEHAKQIKRWCSKVVCLFDGDEAGARASERALVHLLSIGVMARGVFLPKGEDPDSYLKKHGAKNLKLKIKSAEDLFLQLLDKKVSDYSGKTHEKVEIMSWAVQMAGHLQNDSPLISIYMQEVDLRLHVGLPTLRREMGKVLKNKKSPQKPVEEQRGLDGVSRGSSLEEAELEKKVRVRHKKTDPEFVAFSLALESASRQEVLIKENFRFKDPGTQFLWDLVKERHRQDLKSSVRLEALLVRHCDNPEALTLMLEKPYNKLNNEQKDAFFYESFRTAKNHQLTAKAKELTKKIGQNTDDDDLEKFLKLQRKKRNLNENKN